MHNDASLTSKQNRFVEEYLVDANGAQAALRAGYGPCGAKVTACRLLSRPNLRQAIETGRRALSEKLAITRTDIAIKLLEAFEIAKEKREPMGMVRANSELARLLGMMAPAQVKVAVAPVDKGDMGQYSAMSDQQLLALMAKGVPVEAPVSAL